MTLPGIPEFIAEGCDIYVGKEDLSSIAEQSGLKEEQIKSVSEGDRIGLGSIEVEVLATPGHTPGSVCFRISTENDGGILFTGDTLFIGSCGRVSRFSLFRRRAELFLLSRLTCQSLMYLLCFNL